jgi:poly-gamma-glutamate capsule biosynthesis protein CapA/YwtB (metallophosphatase superfamily)
MQLDRLALMNSQTLLLCGDVNLQRREDPAAAFALVQRELAAADVRFGNLEMCLASASSRITEKPGWVQSDASMVQGLVAAAFDVVGCANNVTHGDEAILASLRVLDDHKIAHCGSGRNRAECHRLARVEREGRSFGFLARTTVFFPLGHAATADTPGVAAFRCHTAYEPHPRVNELPGAPARTRSWPHAHDLDELRCELASARKQVDVLVVYLHWGLSGEEEVVEYQRLLAHDVIDHGADIVVGSHAHVPQPVEVYRDRVILYGLGNFVFDWPQMDAFRTGLLAICRVDEKGIESVVVKPVGRETQGQRQPRVLSIESADGRSIIAAVAEASSEFGTSFSYEDDGARVWQRGA